MTTRLLPLVLLLAAGPAAAQAGWRLVQTTDELTAATDTRLILREESWPTEPPKAADAYQGATLIVVCGHRLPSADGRTVLLSADQPMQPYGGGELAYVEMRFDSQPQVTKAYFTRLQVRDGLAVETARRVHRYAAFLGSDSSPYYSPQILARLLAATLVTIRYRAFGRDRAASFHVAGLRDALARLNECRWTP